MMGYLIVGGCCLAAGLFWLLTELAGAPTRKLSRAARQILQSKSAEQPDWFTRCVNALAVPLAKVLPFSSYRLEKIGQTLQSANIATPAKLYLCHCIVKAGLLFLVALAASFLVKPMLIVAFCLPLIVYNQETKRAETLTVQRKTAIERELPNLVATIVAELPGSRDIIRILKGYLPTAGKELRAELAITIADMESGSYETALSRMETRINSSLVNDVLRGLIGAVRGNDVLTYFRMLSYDLKQLELNIMKKAAQKSAPKLNAASMVLLVGILTLFVGVLLADMLAGASAIF